MLPPLPVEYVADFMVGVVKSSAPIWVLGFELMLPAPPRPWEVLRSWSEVLSGCAISGVGFLNQKWIL